MADRRGPPDWDAIAAKRTNGTSLAGVRQRANASIKQSLLDASSAYAYRADKAILEQAKAFAASHDSLGLTAYFLEHMCGTGEDRRAMLAILAKLLPIEVHGALDASLTVKVVTMVGDQEIDITPKKIPKEPVAAATSLSAPPDRAPPEWPRDYG